MTSIIISAEKYYVKLNIEINCCVYYDKRVERVT